MGPDPGSLVGARFLKLNLGPFSATIANYLELLNVADLEPKLDGLLHGAGLTWGRSLRQRCNGRPRRDSDLATIIITFIDFNAPYSASLLESGGELPKTGPHTTPFYLSLEENCQEVGPILHLST